MYEPDAALPAYRKLLDRVVAQNKKFYQRFPGDVRAGGGQNTNYRFRNLCECNTLPVFSIKMASSRLPMVSFAGFAACCFFNCFLLAKEGARAAATSRSFETSRRFWPRRTGAGWRRPPAGGCPCGACKRWASRGWAAPVRGCDSRVFDLFYMDHFARTILAVISWCFDCKIG